MQRQYHSIVQNIICSIVVVTQNRLCVKQSLCTFASLLVAAFPSRCCEMNHQYSKSSSPMLRVTAQIERKCTPRPPILYFPLTVTPGCAVPRLLQIKSDVSVPSRRDASTNISDAKFQVPTAVSLKIQVFWNVALCHWVTVPDVSKDRNAYTPQRIFWSWRQTVIRKAGIIYQTIQRHITQDLKVHDE